MSRLRHYPFEEDEKIYFELHDESKYEAIFIRQTDFTITVYHATELPQNKLISGYTDFYKREISSINTVKNENDSTENEEIKDTKISFSDFQFWTENKETWKYFAVPDEKYYASIEIIKKADTIAVNGIGHHGRKKPFFLLAISTKFNIYIFNVSESFDKEICEILSSKKISKVIYNGAILCDTLTHIYKVELNNYFDLQIADNLVTKDKCLRKLSELLIDYINMPVKDAKSVDKFDIDSVDDLDVDVVENVVNSVAYFIPLKNILEKKMLKDVELTMNYCLNRTRDKSPISALLTNEDLLEELKKMDLKK